MANYVFLATNKVLCVDNQGGQGEYDITSPNYILSYNGFANTGITFPSDPISGSNYGQCPK
jgi:hypothetical protein